MFQLATRASKDEQLIKEKIEIHKFKWNVALVESHEPDESDKVEIAMAKMMFNNPCACPALKPAKVRETPMARAIDTWVYLLMA